MGLLSRNFAVVMALLVALQVAWEVSALPSGKSGGGDGKGGKGKGRRSLAEGAEPEGGVSALEDSFADALAEDAEAALVLEEQVRARRALDQQEQPVGTALAQDEEAAAGQNQLMNKKPCRGNKKGGGNGDADADGGEDATGEASDMQRQRQRKGKGKSNGKGKKGSAVTTETSALANWMIGDAPEDSW